MNRHGSVGLDGSGLLEVVALAMLELHHLGRGWRDYRQT